MHHREVLFFYVISYNFVEVKKMKLYRKQAALLFGAVAVFSYFSIRFFPAQEKEQESITVMETTKQEQIQIYVLDYENTLIPMNRTIEPGKSTEEKLRIMVDAMCADQVKGDFSGVLASGTQLEKTELSGTVAKLYFNEQFASYEPTQELKVLEAITWGATQFPQINEVELYVNGERLRKMPLAQTPIPAVLNRKLGINHFESASASLNDAHTILVYYTKDIDDSLYFVPKSKRIDGDPKDMETVVNEVLKDVSASMNLSSPLYDERIKAVELPHVEDQTLVVNMSNTLLDSDRCAKQRAYEALVLSLAENFEVDAVQVYVDDQVVSLHGSNEEAVSVSSLYYNPIPF